MNIDVNHQLLDEGLVENDGGDAQAEGNNNLQDGENVEEEEAAIDNNEVGSIDKL